jgi:pyrroloquinoline quinone biosynthesis protein D
MTPRLRPGVRLIVDRSTGRPVLLGPERGLVLDDVAWAIVRLVDGVRSLDAIVDALEAKAPRPHVRRDVAAFLEALARRRMVAT